MFRVTNRVRVRIRRIGFRRNGAEPSDYRTLVFFMSFYVFFLLCFFCFMLCCVRLSHCIKEPAAAGGPFLHRSEMRRLIGWKLRIFPYPLSFGAPAIPMFHLAFRGEVKHEETRVMGLLCGKSCIILTATVFDWSTRVSDGQMDGRSHSAL